MRVLFLDPEGLREYLSTFEKVWGRIAVSLAYHEAMRDRRTIIDGMEVRVVV